MYPAISPSEKTAVSVSINNSLIYPTIFTFLFIPISYTYGILSHPFSGLTYLLFLVSAILINANIIFIKVNAIKLFKESLRCFQQFFIHHSWVSLHVFYNTFSAFSTDFTTRFHTINVSRFVVVLYYNSILFTVRNRGLSIPEPSRIPAHLLH